MGKKDDKPDGTLMLFVYLGVTAFFITILWLALRDQLASGVRWIRVGQLYIANIFTDRYDTLREALINKPASTITPTDMWVMSRVTLDFYKYFFPVASLVLMAIAWSDKIPNKNTMVRKFDLEKLIAEMARIFPVISPIVKFNPLKDNFRMLGAAVPSKLPVFAEALSPEEWVAFFDIPRPERQLDVDATRRAFVRQLGKRFEGVDKLPLYMQALFAAFTMKACGQRTESDDFLGDIAACWDIKRGLQLPKDMVKKINQINHDAKMGRVVEKLLFQHAFTGPAMLRALKNARDLGGVLAPAQFLWLRGVDRSLWYALNNLGRPAVMVEAAGAIAHYRAELQAGRPIPNPQLDAAVQSLVNYFKVNDINNIPAKDYSGKAA